MPIYIESEYRGFIVEYATTAGSQPGKWMGHYRVRRDDTATKFGASNGDLHDSRSDAEDAALRFAKDHVAAQQFSEGDVGSFEIVTTGDFVSCECYVGGTWRQAEICGTTLKLLSTVDDRMEAIARIKETVGVTILTKATAFAAPNTIKI